MLIDLHSVKISLTCSDERVAKQWQQLFSYEIKEAQTWGLALDPDIDLKAEVRCCLPPLPNLPILYKSTDPDIIVFYDRAKRLQLRYANAGQIQFWFPEDEREIRNETLAANIVLAERSVNVGAVENLTALALAPLLRRKGLFFVHAFATVFNREAILFAGPSGSGKTSSGLALLTAGWQYLANDLAIIRYIRVPEALLSPGTVQITPATFKLLPQLNQLITPYLRKTSCSKVPVPRQAFIHPDKVVRSAPIVAIIFPSVGISATHQISQVTKAVGYARLMASSMDQWDQGIWIEHIRFLEQLSQNVDFYDLSLGANMSDLSHLLRISLTKS